MKGMQEVPKYYCNTNGQCKPYDNFCKIGNIVCEIVKEFFFYILILKLIGKSILFELHFEMFK